MITTFRETLASIQDPTYGRQIVLKPFKQVLWYWLKYLLLFTLIPLFLIIAAVTYLIPQLPGLLGEYLPEGEIAVKRGQLSINPNQQLTLGTQDFLIIVDPTGASSQSLDLAFSGLLVTQETLWIKGTGGQTQPFPLSDVPDFFLTKTHLIEWLSQHQGQVWIMAFFGLSTLALIIFLFQFVTRLASFFIWSTLFWLLAVAFRHRTPYLHVFRLTLYAAVPSLILSAILFLAPNHYLIYLNIGLFVFFALNWLWNLSPSPKSSSR